MTLETVLVERVMNAPPDRVWQRISTPEGLARWWRPGDIAPVVGHVFTMDMGAWGQVPCRILEVIPERRLVYSFGDFELAWTIIPEGEPEGSTSRLRLEHRGFDLANPRHRFAFDNMGVGWRETVLPRLSDQLSHAA